MAGKLYVVGTPIGNLGDFSPRAIEILRSVDFVAAEDTRVTGKLMNHFEIHQPMLSYYEHNKAGRGNQILSRLMAGETCAVVSDAGLPAISDPGEDLVRLCHENGVLVESVPGPCALVTALSISGMPSGRFTFEGFLSVNKPSRRAHLAELTEEKRTMIFYEAPHKLLATLRDMLEAFGDRPIALVRELTKIHEQVQRTTFSRAISFYEENPPRGEFVLIVEGRKEEKTELSEQQALALARQFLAEGDSPSAAAKKAAAVSGCRKGELYKMLIGMGEKNQNE